MLQAREKTVIPCEPFCVPFPPYVPLKPCFQLQRAHCRLLSVLWILFMAQKVAEQGEWLYRRRQERTYSENVKRGPGIPLHFNSFFGKETQRSNDLLLGPGWLLGSQNSSISSWQVIITSVHTVYHAFTQALWSYYFSLKWLLNPQHSIILYLLRKGLRFEGPPQTHWETE